MSNFVVHPTQVERVLNPQRHEASTTTRISLPSLLPISQRIMTIPSSPTELLRELPTTILHVVEGVEETFYGIAHMTTDVGREVAQLPHRASHEWKQLIWVLGLLVVVPLLVVGVVFFVPMESVNDGAMANKAFLYGISTFYEGLYLIAWVESFNFALQDYDISVSARFLSWIMGLGFCKAFDMLVAGDVVGSVVFPIPFSILITGVLAVPCAVVPVLYWTNARLRKGRGFGGLLRLIAVYWACLLIVTAWAAGVNRLRSHRTAQTVVGCLYAPLRFICKVVIASPVTTKQNPQRWIQLNLVVDMLFTRVQVATFPFIESYLTLLLLFSTEILTLGWRYYNGVDRLALWWSTMKLARNQAKQHGEEDEDSRDLRRMLLDITVGCFRAPILDVAGLHLSLQEERPETSERILRTLTGDTGSISHSEMDSGSEQESDGDLEPQVPLGPFRSMGPFSAETSSKSAVAEISLHKVDPRSIEAIIDIEAACDLAEEQAADQQKGMDEDTATPMPVVSEATIATTDTPDTISIASIQRSLSLTSTSSATIVLQREYREQRVLFHVVDSTGAIVISTITRISQQLCITMVRCLPSAKHLNQSFRISDERWHRAQIYGWLYVALMILLLSRLGFLFFRRIQGFQERKLSLGLVMSYLFKDHFWFFFFWLLSSGVLVCASMVNHFGADFSFQFEWVRCPGQTIWPGCL
eukprot:scaffold6589_cov123-Cylindrotheca_fusiformis.AAC.1